MDEIWDLIESFSEGFHTYTWHFQELRDNSKSSYNFKARNLDIHRS